MKYVIIIAVLWASVANADWSTSYWPSYNSSYQGRGRMIETVSGVNERVFVCPDAVGALSYYGWFQQRSALVACKTKIKTLIPYFLDTTLAGGSADYSGYMQSNNGGLPFLTVTGVLIRAGAPTNYFDSTPWFNLNTATNGYMYITGIVDQLRWTTNTTFTLVSAQEWWGLGVNQASDADAYNAAVAAYASGHALLAGPGAGIEMLKTISPPDPDKYTAGIARENGFYRVTLPRSSNLWHDIDVYLIVDPWVEWFDDQGDNVYTNWLIYSNMASQTGLNSMVQVGNITNTEPPTYYITPTETDPGIYYEYVGWQYKASKQVIRWDVTNGFRLITR